MIYLTRLSHARIAVNSDLIQHIEVTPDTVIALTSGEKILVRESADEVIARIVSFRRSIFQNLPHFVVSETGEAQGSRDLARTENACLPKSSI